MKTADNKKKMAVGYINYRTKSTAQERKVRTAN